MPRYVSCILLFLFGWISTPSGVAQNVQAHPSASPENVVADQALRISFLQIGTVIRHDANGYSLSLQGAGGTISTATAAISVSSERVVELSGSYGGRVNLDQPMAKAFQSGMVKVDSVSMNGFRFRREYWAVYAGMGAWEGVINCYALLNGQYYGLSLDTELMLGKPGEIVEGEQLSAEVLRGRIVQTLSDDQEPTVRRFNDLLASFQISH